jgi:two-component system, OmpR family, KDP operon response regulator KdpE
MTPATTIHSRPGCPARQTGVPAKRVLITGTHSGILRYMARGLALAGYDVETASTQSDAGARAAVRPPDALILEVDMPDGSTIDLFREIRVWSDAAVLLTSTSSTESMIIAGLDAGADDFLTMPVGLDELCARLRAVLRRAAGAGDEIVTAGDLTIDLPRGVVLVAGEPVSLTPTQFKILRFLARHAGKLLTHEEISRAVWGLRHHRSQHPLQVQVSQLRRRIEPDPSRPIYVVTEHGTGLRLNTTTRNSRRQAETRTTLRKAA